jgi:hypothetical protein
MDYMQTAERVRARRKDGEQNANVNQSVSPMHGGSASKVSHGLVGNCRPKRGQNQSDSTIFCASSGRRIPILPLQSGLQLVLPARSFRHVVPISPHPRSSQVLPDLSLQPRCLPVTVCRRRLHLSTTRMRSAVGPPLHAAAARVANGLPIADTLSPAAIGVTGFWFRPAAVPHWLETLAKTQPALLIAVHRRLSVHGRAKVSSDPVHRLAIRLSISRPRAKVS